MFGVCRHARVASTARVAVATLFLLSFAPLVGLAFRLQLRSLPLSSCSFQTRFCGGRLNNSVQKVTINLRKRTHFPFGQSCRIVDVANAGAFEKRAEHPEAPVLQRVRRPTLKRRMVLAAISWRRLLMLVLTFLSHQLTPWLDALLILKFRLQTLGVVCTQ